MPITAIRKRRTIFHHIGKLFTIKKRRQAIQSANESRKKHSKMRNKIWNATEYGKFFEEQAQKMRENSREDSAEDSDTRAMQQFQKAKQLNHAFEKLRAQQKEKRKQRKK